MSYCCDVVATIGLSTATAIAPKLAATSIGEATARSAERPEARITTNSELRASPKNSSKVANSTKSGIIS